MRCADFLKTHLSTNNYYTILHASRVTKDEGRTNFRKTAELTIFFRAFALHLSPFKVFRASRVTKDEGAHQF